MQDAKSLVDALVKIVRTRLPSGVDNVYFEGFVERNRAALVAILERQLAAREARTTPPPDLWTPSQRASANLAAMRIAASQGADALTDADRMTLAAYSGWGGLSIEAVAAQFPTGFPAPEPRGLIHEYYGLAALSNRCFRPPRARRGAS